MAQLRDLLVTGVARFVNGAYFGGASTFGSATRPIWWNNGFPQATTYSLSATLNAGSANRLAYYSGANAVSASAHYASATQVGINITNIDTIGSRAFYVNGTSQFSDDIYANKSIRNLAVDGGLYWNPYVESVTDGSDAASITLIKSGVAGGTELRISQLNDSNDVINLYVPNYIYLKSKRAFTVNDEWLRINDNSAFSSGIYTGTSLIRTDNQLQVGDAGANFYVKNTGDAFIQKTLGINGVNIGYRLYVNGTSYFNNLVTVRTAESHLGIKLGDTYVNAIGGDLIFQNNSAIRFGSDAWDYDQWAGLKYVHSAKTIYLGLADGTHFTANTAQSGGILALPGIRYFSINGKIAIDAVDSWLRINETGGFSSGTYFGNTIVRTDNQFQVGNNGANFYANSSGNGYFSNTLGIAGTNTSYNLYVNGTSYFNGNIYLPKNGNIYAIGSKATHSLIRVVDNTSDALGNGISIGGGGVTIIGSGESSQNLSVAGAKEILYLLSDGAINIEANANTIANRIGIQVTTAGNIIPIKAEVAQINSQSIGTATNYFANMYATTFHGNLDGNADTVDGYHFSDLESRYVNVSGDTMTGALNFANNTWNLVGDDVYFGDHNVAGGFGIYGKNGNTRLDFCQYNAASIYQSIIFDGNTLYASSKFGVNGSNSSYNFYVNGTSYFSGYSNVCKIYNSSNYEDSSSVTFTNLAAYNGASCGMINAATDNPLGTSSWCHAWSQTWNNGTTSSWVSQIVLGTQNGSGMWYRCTSGDIAGRSWIRVLDTNNYASTLDDRYVNITGDTMTGDLIHGGHIYANIDYTYDIGQSTKEFRRLYTRNIATRHLDADAVFNSDHSLYIGYGSSAYTTAIKMFYSPSTSSRTEFFQINSNGAYAPIRFGVNGQNTDYNFYVNGSSYISSTLVLNHSIWNRGGYSCAGLGQYWYCKIATLKITSSWINRPVCFEISGRGRNFTLLSIVFQNTNSTDPTLAYFHSNWDNCYWIVKTGTSTWDIYVKYSETYGDVTVHRITGNGSNISVIMVMSNASSLPSGATQASYGGNVYYATLANTAKYLSNASHSISISQSDWTNNPWGAGNLTLVWGQRGANYSLSGDTADITLCYGTGGKVGGAGWFMSIDGGLYSLAGIYSAVWNDYAEFRQASTEEPGRVVYELGDDSLAETTQRLQHFAGIISDTYGFSEGKTEKANTPLAVAGRVLAYPYQNRNNYKPGDCVCAAPNGTVDIMTRDEIAMYPDRIVGTVSCVPEYETWGTGNVKVNGRIWIKVK